MPSRQLIAQTGEDIAATFLKHQSYQIIERNWRTKQWGEIDIIAVESGQLVFVEVKARVGDSFGYPEEAITDRKLWALRRAGQFYQLAHPDLPESLRIDVVAITFHPDLTLKDTQLFFV